MRSSSSLDASTTSEVTYQPVYDIPVGTFDGNTDGNTEVTRMFNAPVEGSSVRVTVQSFHGSFVAMRLGLLECTKSTGVVRTHCPPPHPHFRTPALPTPAPHCASPLPRGAPQSM